MPVDLEIRHGNIGLALVCHGLFNGKELISVHDQLLSSPDLLKPVKYALVDEVGVESIDIAIADLQQIAEQDKQLKDLFIPHLPVAIAATRDLQYGLARMWEVLAADTGWEVMVFRTLPEAAGWIQQRMKERFDIDLPVESDAR
jgi:hypothetical protein